MKSILSWNNVPSSAGLIVLFVQVLSITGCIGLPGRVSTPEEEYGNRIEGESDDGRETLSIRTAESGIDYRVLPATYESVTIRPQPFVDAKGQDGVSVELLIKGSLPDACTELHNVKQERTGNIVRVDLEMRRPRGMVCATVLRPYRFYLMLSGQFPAGPYTLVLNDRVKPFEILVSDERG